MGTMTKRPVQKKTQNITKHGVYKDATDIKKKLFFCVFVIVILLQVIIDGTFVHQASLPTSPSPITLVSVNAYPGTNVYLYGLKYRHSNVWVR